MNLRQVDNLANTNAILRDLRNEAREMVLNDLGAVVLYHEAQSLAAEAEAMLASANKDAAGLEKRKNKAEKELEQLEADLLKLQHNLETTELKLKRVLIGKEKGERPSLDPIQHDIRQTKSALSDARGEARTAYNKLLSVQSDMRGLTQLLERLKAIEKPSTPALDLVLRRNGHD